MKKKRKKLGVSVTLGLLIVVLAASLLLKQQFATKKVSSSISTKRSDSQVATIKKSTQPVQQKTKKPSMPKLSVSKSGVINVSQLTNKQWLKLIEKNNFQKPSDGPYPKITNWSNVWIDANITKQRLYIKNGNKILYTMLTSSGLDTNPNNSTPLGTYHVQKERGRFFYSASEKEGAYNWTSWKGHGVFLFHTVPTDQQGHILMKDAERLGQKDSHGCFHLTFADAKWIEDHVPVGTKVVIQA